MLVFAVVIVQQVIRMKGMQVQDIKGRTMQRGDIRARFRLALYEEFLSSKAIYSGSGKVFGMPYCSANLQKKQPAASTMSSGIIPDGPPIWHSKGGSRRPLRVVLGMDWTRSKFNWILAHEFKWI